MFSSFFLAGFESATGYNRNHEKIDQIAATGHDKFIDQDYRLLSEAGICAARDAIRWPLVDHNGHFDMTTVDPLIEAGRKHGVEIIYDLFHYGYPDDVDLFSDTLPERFAEYVYAVTKYLADRTEGTLYLTPVNEPSYFAFAGGEVGWFAPHAIDRGGELKHALIRALIQGIDAAWSVSRDVRIVNVDPICRVVAPSDHPELERRVDEFNDKAVFESFDMIAGRVYPEYGGSREHLDIVGLNYYWTNQWELTREGTPLAADDPRLLPLHLLIKTAWDRYGGEMLITETSHVLDMRPRWVRELADETEKMLDLGINLQGICLYPILGMPEWHAQEEWTRLGLWDVHPEHGRILYDPMFEALREAQARLESDHARRGQILAGRPRSRERAGG
ncbi:MAG: hypothetical protein ACM3JD_17005 [Rudaea sp.]